MTAEMLTIRVAGLNVGFRFRYDHLPAIFSGYRTDCAPDFVVEASDEAIARYQAMMPEQTPAYCETVAAHAAMCEQLWTHGAFCMHAAAIAMDGRAYLFAAMSGTGKSTHIRQWGRRFGRRVTVINGDKPLLRLGADGVFRACGSPWCGKEGWQTNTEAPLAGICFLERAETDFIEPMDNRAVLQKLFLQVVVPEQDEHVDACLTLLDWLVSTVPCYRLGCTISPHAAEVAWRGMNPQEETV